MSTDAAVRLDGQVDVEEAVRNGFSQTPADMPPLSLCLCIPSLGAASRRWAATLPGLFKAKRPSAVRIVIGRAIDDAREMLAEYAIDSKLTYLAFLGDDMLCPAGCFEALVNILEQQPSIPAVSGLYYTKTDPSEPVAWKHSGLLRDGVDIVPDRPVLAKVAGTGLDVTVIRATMIERMKQPRFLTDTLGRVTEDVHFWNRFSEANGGARPYLYTGLLAGHYCAVRDRVFAGP